MDGKSLVVGSDDGKIQSLRLSDASVEQTFDAEGMRTFDFAFLEDGKKLRAACSDGKFRVWDWQTGKLQGRSQMAFLRYFSPVVSTRSGGTIFADGPLLTFWPKGGGPKLDFKAHETQITGVAVSANEKVLASVDRTGILRVWNAAGKPHLVELRCDEGDTLLTLSADGSLLAACSQEHNDRIRIWRLAHDPSGKTTATELHLDSGHKSLVKRLAFFQNGERLLSTSNDDTARLWDVKTGKCMACLEEGYWAAVSPDGRQVALHGHKASYTINVLDMTDLKRPKKYSAFDGCGPLAFSPVANRLAHLMGVKPCKVVISDLASKRPVRDFPNVTYSAYSMAYSSDGRLLAVGGADNIVRVWDVVKGQQKFSLKANPQWLAFTPNGRFLVTEKALWDMENGKLSVQLDDKVAEMTAVALPDNSRLVTGGIDRMIRVWDLKSGRLLRSIAGHTGKVYASAISPDGKRLATGGSDGEILVWDVQKTFP
jgi:WD40 repeat protein